MSTTTLETPQVVLKGGDLKRPIIWTNNLNLNYEKQPQTKTTEKWVESKEG